MTSSQDFPGASASSPSLLNASGDMLRERSKRSPARLMATGDVTPSADRSTSFESRVVVIVQSSFDASAVDQEPLPQDFTASRSNGRKTTAEDAATIIVRGA